jgi:hypothetical protein
VIEQVNTTRNQQLDLIHFSLPKLRLGFKGDHDVLHPMVVYLSPSFGPNAPYALSVSGAVPLASLAQTIRPRQFLSWTELDRVIPGTNALFALSVLDKSNAYGRENSYRADRDSSGDLSSDSSSQSPGLCSTINRTIALWKIVQEDTQFVIKGESKCVVYRFEWSDEMLYTAITRMRFLIREDDEEARAMRESTLSESDRLESVEFA